MPTPTETTRTSDEQALVLVSGTATHAVGTPGTLAWLADDFATVDQEIHAARRQMIRGVHETVEGWVRLAIALAKMHHSRLYLQVGYPTFAAYLQECHQLSEDTATRFVYSLETLGPDSLRELLTNVGIQRTYYLSQIQRLAPPVFEELLALPPVAGQPAVAAIEINELAQMVADLKAQLAQAYTEQAELADQLTAEQHLGKSITARLADIERVNQQLVTARNKVERELDQVKAHQSHTHTSALKKLRELERQNRDLQQQLEATCSTARTSAPGPTATESEHALIATYDPTLLADLIATCITSLRRYRQLAHQLKPEQVHALYTAIAELIASGEMALLIPVVRACATALRRYSDSTALPPDCAGELYAALNTFGPAAVALYPEEAADGCAR
jgi:hypothetical protein